MKKIIAIAALAAAVSTCAHATVTFDTTVTGTHDSVMTTHTVAFNVNPSYTPLTFTDTPTSATELAEAGDANRVVVASSFNAKNGHQYSVGPVTVAGANAGVLMTASFSAVNEKPTVPDQKTVAHVDADGTLYILLTQNASTALTAGSTNATYTVTDYSA
ncbi:hypothetical protein JHS31_000490 [Salmonella enterica]|nr:hypothetical protein [Salmonella enterica]